MTFSPLSYQLKLEIDLENFEFSGTVRSEFDISEPISLMKLDILNLQILKITTMGKEIKFNVPQSQDSLFLYFDEPIQGTKSFDIEYRGLIGKDLRGFYRSKYYEEDQERYIAISQFFDNEARRLFPCLDSPQYKAEVTISVTTSNKYLVISNMPIKNQEIINENTNRVNFNTTPPISTYLLFLGVGSFEIIHDNIISPEIRVVALPNQSKNGVISLEYCRKLVNFANSYFGIEYPLPKLDLVAAKDIAYGAMENWGAILFKESALLIHSQTTINSKLSIITTIAHEIAHQWFGNLVSPNSWKFIWLNESFATFFGYKMVHNIHPEWNMFQRFVNNNSVQAMYYDSFRVTSSIEQRGVEEVPLTPITIPIVYSKGGSILRQLEGFIGKDTFQKGLQNYLKKFSYSVANSSDLWYSFESVSDFEIVKMMEQWINTPGYPLISVKRNGKDLLIQQEQFTLLASYAETLWNIPVTITQYFKNGTKRIDSFVFKNYQDKFNLAEDIEFFKFNNNHSGFYRVQYQNSDLDNILNNLNKLNDLDRYNILHDTYALFVKGKLSFETYAKVVNSYEKENAGSIIQLINSQFLQMYQINPNASRVKKLGKRIFGEIITNIGFQDQLDDPIDLMIGRKESVYLSSLFDHEPSKDYLTELYNEIKLGNEIDQNMVEYVLKFGAINFNEIELIQIGIKNARQQSIKNQYISALMSLSDPKFSNTIFDFLSYSIDLSSLSNAIIVLSNNVALKSGIWE